MMRKLIAYSTIICAVILCSHLPNYAQVLVSESFNYTNGTAMHGLNGGTGWAASWFTENNNTNSPGYSATNSLISYSSCSFTGNAMIGGRQYLSIGREISRTGTMASYTANTDGNLADGNEIGAGNLRIKFFLQKLRNDDGGTSVNFGDFDAASWNGTTNNKFGVGYYGTDSNSGGIRYWTLRLNGTTYLRTNVPVSINTTTYIVVDVRFNAQVGANPTLIQVYINPPCNSTLPTPTLSSYTSSFGFKHISIYLGDSPMPSYQTAGIIDEFSIEGILSVLPVTLIEFSGKIVNNNTAKLLWKTVDEINNDFFLIEKSSDALSWKTIGEVVAQKDVEFVRNYSFIDGNMTSEYAYYRLKQVDKDGRFSYSNIIYLPKQMELNKIKINIYPNPTNGVVFIESTQNELSDIQVYNSLGQEMHSIIIRYISSNVYHLDITNLAQGVYYVKTKSLTKTVIKH
ncbi:MAG: T9SS C-terminal target domain-containing protein [Cytophagales bacterium]|nr:MAG: T9SS C-terminal target domain-containing protein [Cytophagales bacterium]